MTVSGMDTLGLYVHMPWCVRKCPYCDFNSHAGGQDATERQRYLRALIKDLEYESARSDGRSISSIFIGGGTPSLFTSAEISDLLSSIAGNFSLQADCEITMEANPGTVECDRLDAYRKAGINRLSLGAQSFDSQTLKRLGRIHTAADSKRVFQEARVGGFDNINLDLMHALPGQSLADGLKDVQALLKLQPDHVSYYQLTLEANTVFHSTPPSDLPDEGLADDIQQQGHVALAEAGFEQYEVSAFAQPGKACRHNLNYWRFGDYLAVGAGAHGKRSLGPGLILRTRKPAHPHSYMQSQEQEKNREVCQHISGHECAFEFMLNILRLKEGFSEQMLSSVLGEPDKWLQSTLFTTVNDGLLDQPVPGKWLPSRLGQRFLNDLQARFLPAC